MNLPHSTIQPRTSASPGTIKKYMVQEGSKEGSRESPNKQGTGKSRNTEGTQKLVVRKQLEVTETSLVGS